MLRCVCRLTIDDRGKKSVVNDDVSIIDRDFVSQWGEQQLETHAYRDVPEFASWLGRQLARRPKTFTLNNITSA